MEGRQIFHQKIRGRIKMILPVLLKEIPFKLEIIKSIHFLICYLEGNIMGGQCLFYEIIR